MDLCVRLQKARLRTQPCSEKPSAPVWSLSTSTSRARKYGRRKRRKRGLSGTISANKMSVKESRVRAYPPPVQARSNPSISHTNRSKKMATQIIRQNFRKKKGKRGDRRGRIVLQKPAKGYVNWIRWGLKIRKATTHRCSKSLTRSKRKNTLLKRENRTVCCESRSHQCWVLRTSRKWESRKVKRTIFTVIVWVLIGKSILSWLANTTLKREDQKLML